MPDEPHRADHDKDRGHEEVEAQAEDGVGGVNAQQLLEDAKGRVTQHVEGEQRSRSGCLPPAQPDQEASEREVEEQLVQERRVEGGAVDVALRSVLGVDLQAPWEAGRAAEQFLVEVVADSPDRLRSLTW